MKKILAAIKILGVVVGFFLLGPLIRICLDKPLSLPYAPRHISDLSRLKDQAMIEVYGAGAGQWQSYFSLHTWIGFKRAGEEQFTIYEVRKELLLENLSTVDCWKGNPDRAWVGNRPERLLSLEGAPAAALIPLLERAIHSYPFQHRYATWPGPNCNTFIAYLGRTIKGLGLELPPNAIGKDFLLDGEFFTTPPSGNGFQCSFFGLLGWTISVIEGVEINFLSFNFGFQPKNSAILYPGIGKIPLVVKKKPSSEDRE